MLKRNSIINMDIANDEQQQLARKLKEFVGNARIRNINIKKKIKRAFKIVHWHFSKEQKWYKILLEVGYFQYFCEN